MTITLCLFAAARELVGADEVILEIPAGGTVADLKRELARGYPKAAALIARSAIARNHEYALDSDPIAPGDELAVIPPVSGG